VTEVGDVGRPWLSVAAPGDPALADGFHEPLATNVALDQALGAQSISRNEASNSHATDASSAATCTVTVRPVDSRTVSPGRQSRDRGAMA